MWVVEEERTLVNADAGKVLHLTSFGPRVHATSTNDAAADACKLTIENRFNQRVAYRWKANSANFTLTPTEGLLEPKSSAIVEFVAQPNTVVLDMIFAYVTPTSRPKDADVFWRSLEDVDALRLCYRKRVTIRRSPRSVVKVKKVKRGLEANNDTPRGPWFVPKTISTSIQETKKLGVKCHDPKPSIPKLSESKR